MDSLYVWCVDKLKQAILLLNRCRRLRNLYYGAIIGTLILGAFSGFALQQFSISAFAFIIIQVMIGCGFILIVKFRSKYRTANKELNYIGRDIEVIREIIPIVGRKDWKDSEIKTIKVLLNQLPIFNRIDDVQ